jgi:hypothetical protein
MIDDYLLATGGLDPQSLLAEWRWLIGDHPFAIRAAATVGNLFLQNRAGEVFLIEVEDGTCERIARTGDEFEAMLADRRSRGAWLQTYLVRELRRDGMTLGPGQCYGRKVPLLFGGGPEGAELRDAYEPIDLAAHVSILGQLHRQASGHADDGARAEPPPGA